MLRRISVLLLLGLVMSTLPANGFMLELPSSGALAQPDPPLETPGQDDLSGRGVQRAAEQPHDTGKPNDPNAWGAVTSRTASDTSDSFNFGQHASDPLPNVEGRETPRFGIGNVAANDEEQAQRLALRGLPGTDPSAEGTHVSEHACVVDTAFGTSCELDPGKAE